jgi:hypothetical protein
MGLYESIHKAIRTSLDNPEGAAPSGPASGGAAPAGGGGVWGGPPGGISGGVSSGLPPETTPAPETAPAVPRYPLSELMRSGLDGLARGGEGFIDTVAGDGPSLPSLANVGSSVVDAYGNAAKNVAGLFDGLF